MAHAAGRDRVADQRNAGGLCRCGRGDGAAGRSDPRRAAPELVWLLEHPPLYTAGTSARDEELLEPQRLPVHRTRPRRPLYLSRARPADRLCHARSAPARAGCALLCAPARGMDHPDARRVSRCAANGGTAASAYGCAALRGTRKRSPRSACACVSGSLITVWRSMLTPKSSITAASFRAGSPITASPPLPSSVSPRHGGGRHGVEVRVRGGIRGATCLPPLIGADTPGMNRRSLLRRAATLALLPVLPRTLRSALSENAPARRVRPSDAGWPGEASWAELNEAVGGRLIKVNSPLSACREAADGAACGDLFKELKNPYYIGDNVALTQTAGWVDAWEFSRASMRWRPRRRVTSSLRSTLPATIICGWSSKAVATAISAGRMRRIRC